MLTGTGEMSVCQHETVSQSRKKNVVNEALPAHQAHAGILAESWYTHLSVFCWPD